VKFAGVFLISLLYDLFMQISLNRGTAVPGKIEKQTYFHFFPVCREARGTFGKKAGKWSNLMG
jgi:hypothetical protein